jgi:hypothetical protein
MNSIVFQTCSRKKNNSNGKNNGDQDVEKQLENKAILRDD